MEPLFINHYNGMFDITSDQILYSKIENGIAMQVSNESRRKDIGKACGQIYNDIIKLEKLLEK